MDDRRGETPHTDDNTDILEVFGAQPLVEETSEEQDGEDDTSALAARLDAIETSLAEMSRQAGFLPPKLRRIGDRVDALATTLAHDRCRDLLSELCALDDVVRAAVTALDEGDPDAPLRGLGAVANQLRALFERQGLREIATDGGFDATLHQAVRSVPVDDPEHDGAVIEVDRRGFSADDQVLRFAEVAVGRFDAAEHDDGAAHTDHPTPSPDDAAPSDSADRDDDEPPPISL